MRNEPFIEKLLVETGAYQDLEQPVILVSGELGIYYLNSEKLCPDGGKWKDFGDNARGMIEHTIDVARNNPSFQKVIDIVKAGVQPLFPIGSFDKESGKKIAVSGGQRRDWIFSGPIAQQLELPHISLYKQEDGKEDRVEIIHPDGRLEDNPSIAGYEVVHVVDLITVASSVYRKENEIDKGWVPMLRNRGASIDHVVSVVTREQGGEGNLINALQGEKAAPIIAHPFVAIDKRFLEGYSNNPERALAYKKDPEKWAKDYIMDSNNDITQFAEYFDPNGNKRDRALKFLKNYGTVLKWTNKWKELEAAVHQRYGINFK